MGALARTAAIRTAVVGLAAAVLVAITGATASAAGAPPINPQALPIASGVLTDSYSAVVSHNGKTLYVGDLTGVFAFNLAHPSATPVAITAGGNPLSSAIGLALSPNGKRLYISAASDVEIADVSGLSSDPNNDKVVGQISDPNSLLHNPAGLAVSANGKYLYIGDVSSLGGGTPNGQLAVAQLTSADAGQVVEAKSLTGVSYGLSMALSPNGKLLYVSNWFEGPVAVLKVSGLNSSFDTVLNGTKGVFGLAVSADGRTLYGSSTLPNSSNPDEFNSAVKTFALTNGGLKSKLARTPYDASPNAVLGMGLAPNGRTGYITNIDVSGSPVGGISKFAIPLAATRVSISGRAKPGSTVTAKVTGTSSGSDAYTWFANGKAIKGATKGKLVIAKGLVGKKLTVKVTATAVGYCRSMLTSKAVKVS